MIIMTASCKSNSWDLQSTWLQGALRAGEDPERGWDLWLSQGHVSCTLSLEVAPGLQAEVWHCCL